MQFASDANAAIAWRSSGTEVHKLAQAVGANKCLWAEAIYTLKELRLKHQIVNACQMAHELFLEMEVCR